MMDALVTISTGLVFGLVGVGVAKLLVLAFGRRRRPPYGEVPIPTGFDLVRDLALAVVTTAACSILIGRAYGAW